MNKNRLKLAVLLAALFLGGVNVALAEDTTSVVGADGAVLSLHKGAYGDLFPDGVAATRDSSVLALDIVNGSKSERLIVPGTEDYYAETSAVLYFDKNFGRAFVLFDGVISGIHQVLNLISFDGTQWSDPVQIVGNTFARKTNLQLILRSDRAGNEEQQDDGRSDNRLFLFVTWTEESGSSSRHRLTPLLLLDDNVVGLDHGLFLSDVLPPKFDSSRLDGDFSSALRLQGAPGEASAVVGFVEQEAARLATVGIEALPIELSRLAERVEEIVGSLDLNAPLSLTVNEIQRQILLEGGQDFNRALLYQMAEEVGLLIRSVINGTAEDDGKTLQDKARAQIALIGMRARVAGLEDDAPARLIEVSENGDGQAPYHHIKVSVISNRLTPEVHGFTRLFLSSSGHDALVAWDDGASVHFRETDFGSWSDVMSIEATSKLPVEEIYRLLEERTLNR